MSSTHPTKAFPIIDSHIHLYAASHISKLTWTGDLPNDHVLNRGFSVGDYEVASSSANNLVGFVFVETDRKSGLREEQWEDAIAEVEYLARIATGKMLPDEDGNESRHGKLVSGVVPWAPIPAGPQQLAKYVERVLQAFPQDKRHLIKGFRYLLQDKPDETMLQPAFFESLLWLDQNGFSFDLGVDARSVGLHMLDEVCELFDRLDHAGSRLPIIINHFCKPNLHLSRPEALGGHPDFVRWKQSVEKMARRESTYMKLSGLFSELPPQTESEPTDISVLFEHIEPWIDVVFKAFTPSRILFGSDWPVCNVSGPGIKQSWTHWHALVTAILDQQHLTDPEKAMIWSGTAAKAYSITSPPPTENSQTHHHQPVNSLQ